MHEPMKPHDGRKDEHRRFGEMLRATRRARGLSQAALAKAAGISPVFVSQIETGQRIPSDRVAKDISTALDLPWREILRGVWSLRSREAGELFAHGEDADDVKCTSLASIPAFRLLLFEVASLNLSAGDVDKLVRNWSSDLALIRDLREAEAR